MDKKFWISGIVAAVLFYGLGFVVHGVLLHDDYAMLPNLFRPKDEAMRHMVFMILANLIMGFSFAWIYRQGVAIGASWVQQGIRYGIAVSLLTAVSWYLIYYAVQPMPGMVVVKQIIFESIAIVIIAIVVALINKPADTV